MTLKDILIYYSIFYCSVIVIKTILCMLGFLCLLKATLGLSIAFWCVLVIWLFRPKTRPDIFSTPLIGLLIMLFSSEILYTFYIKRIIDYTTHFKEGFAIYAIFCGIIFYFLLKEKELL